MLQTTLWYKVGMVDADSPGAASDGDDLDEVPLGLDQMLELVDEQRRAVAATQLRPAALMYAIWACSWFIGYMMLWSAFDGGNPWFRVDVRVAAWSFGLLIAASALASVIIGSTTGRGVRGISAFQGTVYGWGWAGLSVSMGALGTALSKHGDPYVAALYFPSAYAIMAGAMFLFGAALWRIQSQLPFAILLLLAGAIAPFLGSPTNYAIMAGAGIAFGVMAVLTAKQLRNSRPASGAGPDPRGRK